MKKKADIGCSCDPEADMGTCMMEAVVTIDGRGQMVLPKKVRDRAGIEPGDRLTVITWEKDGKVNSISLIKADDFEEMVKAYMEPAMRELGGAKNGK
jgi:AbrB family looped-hinge helix DNA binding protein